MTVLRVHGLSKSYPTFKLSDVSFEMAPGTIMGFVGRNGAGKTTTLKSLLGFVHPDAGEVEFFGMKARDHEFEIKERLSFTFGEVHFYPKKTIREITRAYRPFFSGWDERGYRSHLERFQLDESKQLSELSQGMRVKYALTLALSHGAELLLLDEPTSGLDPVSRDELLRLFRSLVADGRTSILFSTHILSDVQRCADTITYIKQGRVLASTSLAEFLATHRPADGEADDLESIMIRLERE